MLKNGIVGGIADWMRHPFESQGSALNWVLFVGLIIIAAFLWQMVLLEITNN